MASPTHVHTAVLALFTRTDPNLTASAYLFPGYVPLLLALLYSFEVSRFAAGARTVVLSLYAWAAVWISGAAIEALWPALQVPPLLWNDGCLIIVMTRRLTNRIERFEQQ